MKKTDIAAIVLIAVITTVIAYFTGNALLGDPNEETARITYMDIISADIVQPNPEVFNPQAVNPTVEVYIGNCPSGQTWDASNQICLSPEEDSEAGTSATDPENSETGE